MQAIGEHFPAVDITAIIAGLEQTPVILAGLLAQIPGDALICRRIAEKWCIHEHACHIASGDQDGFLDRWKLFQEHDRPAIKPLSGESYPPDHFMRMDLKTAMQEFIDLRAELVRLAREADPEFLNRQAEHPEYQCFTPAIMLRHRLMHDHYHMYRIEELWLTRDENLSYLDAVT